MINELIFILYNVLLAFGAFCAVRLGQSGLIAYSSLLAVLANLFAFKTITFMGFTATASDSLIIASTLSFSLLQDRYGNDAARHALWVNLFCIIIFTLCGYMHNWYMPASTDTTNMLYCQLFIFIPRIMAASFVAYAISQAFNYQLFKFLSTKTHAIATATFLSAVLSQLVDTILFAILGLYGVVEGVEQIIFISYCIKLFALVSMAPFLKLLIHYNK